MHWIARGVTGGLYGSDLQINAQRLEVNLDVEKSDIMFPTSFRRLKHHVPLLSLFFFFLFCAQRIWITTNSITFDCLIWKNHCVVYLFLGVVIFSLQLNYTVVVKRTTHINLILQQPKKKKKKANSSIKELTESEGRGVQRLTRLHLIMTGCKKCMWIHVNVIILKHTSICY